MDPDSSDDAHPSRPPNALLRGSTLDGTRQHLSVVVDDCTAPQQVDHWWGRETYWPTGELCIINGRLLAVLERAPGSSDPAA